MPGRRHDDLCPHRRAMAAVSLVYEQAGGTIAADGHVERPGVTFDAALLAPIADELPAAALDDLAAAVRRGSASCSSRAGCADLGGRRPGAAGRVPTRWMPNELWALSGGGRHRRLDGGPGAAPGDPFAQAAELREHSGARSAARRSPSGRTATSSTTGPPRRGRQRPAPGRARRGDGRCGRHVRRGPRPRPRRRQATAGGRGARHGPGHRAARVAPELSWCLSIRRASVRRSNTSPRQGATVKYLLLICWDTERMNAQVEPDPTETPGDDDMPWVDDLRARGTWIIGDQLAPPRRARTVRSARRQPCRHRRAVRGGQGSDRWVRSARVREPRGSRRDSGEASGRGVRHDRGTAALGS